MSAIVLIFLATMFFIFTTFPANSESVVVRQELNISAIKLWQRSPIVGIGLGNFLVNLPHALPSRQIYFLQPVHNIYLLLLSEVGVVGVGLLVYVVIRKVSSIKYQVSRKKRKYVILNTLYLIPLISILALGLVDHYPLTLQQGQLLTTIFVCLVIAYR